MAQSNVKKPIINSVDSDRKVELAENTIEKIVFAISDLETNKIDIIFKKQNKLLDQYSELFKSQKERINKQKNQINNLTERIETMENLLFDMFLDMTTSDEKIKLIRYGIKELTKNEGRI
ncbi:hypothetical protein ABES02_29505 [Neobacillus pocheonensis]|uniref:hypothetical protein n=1 Tax=Neobacillus pocheonensis TaxID=363869 RepID=UPI003D2B627A